MFSFSIRNSSNLSVVCCGQMSWSWITIMALSWRTLFWLSCVSFLPGKADDTSHIRGVPGKDYPNYSSIPQTSFRCSEQLHIPGLYADPETRCQVFHHCYEHRQESFLCPLGTVFNQAILACDYWYSADCNVVPWDYSSYSLHQDIVYNTEPGFAPIKTPPNNLFDKMASLYEVNDDFPTESGNEAHSFEENHSFSDRDRPLIVQSKPVIKSRHFIETNDYFDRHDIVLDDLLEDVQHNEDIEDIRNFEDSFGGSGEFFGESNELEGEVQSGYLWPSNEKNDFGNQQFDVMPGEHEEEKTKPYDHSYYKDEPMDPLTDYSNELPSSSKVSSVPGEKLVRRYSENNANPYSRKSMKRKPLFTINESQEEITTTELSTDKVKTSSIDPVDQGTTSASTESMPASNFPDSSVKPYKEKRRRKPIMIDLEDSLQYNIDSAKYPNGVVSVNYEVDPQSEIPGVSIAAEEISVKLIPSEVKHKLKPVGEYLFNHYNEEETESSTINYVTSPASNINYEATTFPSFKELEISEDDFAVNFDRINSIRKKNKIRIIDSDANHVGIDDGEKEDTPLDMSQFEDEILFQPIEEKFQNFEDHSSATFEEISEQEPMSEVSLKNDEVITDSSYLITEHDAVKVNNLVPDAHDIHNILQETLVEPHELFQKSDDLDRNYISHVYHENSFGTEQFVGDSDLDEKTTSIILKNVLGFDVTTHGEMQDETYFTTEPISDISTNVPLEIQNAEDSADKFYFVPQSNFHSEYDNSDISKNTWSLVPATLEENHVSVQLESGSFDLDPPYHVFLEDSISSTELPHSEDVELQTIISDSYENDTEIENRLPNTESKENILDHNNRTSISSTSKNIANNNYAHSGETSTVSDILLDKELHDHISYLDSTEKLDVILTETKKIEDSALEDVTEKPSSEIQRHLINETVDFDAMKKQDDVIDQTSLLVLNTNSPQLKNIEYKGNAESEDIQGGVFDLSNDFPETSDQFDSDPLVTSNSIVEASENPSFLKNFNAFRNGALNSNQKLLKNVGMKADISQVIDSSQLKNTEKPIQNKAHSGVLPTNQGGMKNVKTRPLRSVRALTSPYQMIPNMEAFGSQYLAGFPSSVLKLKQSNFQKLVPYSGHAFEDGAFYARTGSLLESPKISKLISIGKKLLRAKQAKYRILSRYVDSFKSNQ